MTTIEKQIEEHKEELTRLEKLKQETKNSLLNKTTRIVVPINIQGKRRRGGRG